jgi:UDP-N-acetylmuramate dehydrogenase
MRAQLGPDVRPPAFPARHGPGLETGEQVKTSAAWLVERAGFHRGYGNPNGIAISGKHTLALTNRGSGTTAELIALAREIAGGVRCHFGVVLEPEPVFVGLS